jgi:hypothetical protein
MNMLTSILMKLGLAVFSALPVERILAALLNKWVNRINPSNIDKARKTAEHLAELAELFNDILADKAVSPQEVSAMKASVIRARERLLAAWAVGADAKPTQKELAKTGLLADYVEPLIRGVGCIVLCVLMLGASGCAGLSAKKIAAAGKIAESYYNSANVAELWRMSSSNNTGRVVFENFNEFVMNTPVPPKTIIPREPTFWEGAWDTVKTLGPWAFFGYAMGGGGLANHTSTTFNNAAPAQ